MSDMNDDNVARAATEPTSGRTPEEWSRLVNDLFDRAKAKFEKEPHVPDAVHKQRFDDLLEQVQAVAMNEKKAEDRCGSKSLMQRFKDRLEGRWEDRSMEGWIGVSGWAEIDKGDLPHDAVLIGVNPLIADVSARGLTEVYDFVPEVVIGDGVRMYNSQSGFVQEPIPIQEGVFGFIVVKGQRQRCVVYQFIDGRLLVRHFGFQAECRLADFEPSRDAFFCGVSGIEPEWAGDSARCLNWEELGV